MRDAHAKAKTPHPRESVASDSTAQLLCNQFSAPIVARVKAFQVLHCVGSTTPARSTQIDAVVQPVVLEWDEQLPFESVPQAQLGGDVVVEIGQQRAAIASFGCRCQAQEYARPNVLDERLI